jgi:hypothetical protein
MVFEPLERRTRKSERGNALSTAHDAIKALSEHKDGPPPPSSKIRRADSTREFSVLKYR